MLLASSWYRGGDIKDYKCEQIEYRVDNLDDHNEFSF
jgi:hypothetical protein